MPDERSRRFTGSIPVSGPGNPGSGSVRDPRLAVAAPFRYRYQSIIDFIETQAVNVSRSGMFVSSSEPLAVGTRLDFEFSLADGFPLLRGSAEVVRVSARPTGMGLRFLQLDEASGKLIDRIVEVNTQEGRRPTVPLDFTEPPPSPRREVSSGGVPSPIPAMPSAPRRAAGGGGGGGMFASGPAAGLAPGVQFNGSDIRVEISASTVSYFTNNPLLNIRLGGFVVPGPDEVPLGAIFGVTVVDSGGGSLFDGKGKVVAKHEQRLGIRMTNVPKETLARLQAEIARYAAAR